MANEIWCRHYRGLFDHNECSIGVNYDAVKMNGSYPCIAPQARGNCSQFESYTEGEIAEDESKIELYIKRLNSLQNGKTDICPQCGERISSMRKIVRCVYAQPCNCRLWQGEVPQAWTREYDD